MLDNTPHGTVRRYHILYGSRGHSVTVYAHTESEAAALATEWIGSGVPIAIPSSDSTTFAAVDDAIDAESLASRDA